MLWNARGLLSKLNEFKNHIYSHQPSLICFTETHLKPFHSPRLKNYDIIRADRLDGFGGVAIAYHNSIQTRQHSLTHYPNGEMQALSIQYCYKNKWATVIVLYNPCKNVCNEEFEHYFEQIDTVGVICGDMNAHHQSWESQCNTPNVSGNSLFLTLNNSANLSLLNPKDLPTRIDPKTGKSSNLDLIIATQEYLDKEVRTGEDLGSDHNVITMSEQDRTLPRLFFRPRWKLRENWAEWRTRAEQYEPDVDKSYKEQYDDFIKHLLNVSKNIFKLCENSSPQSPGQPWWNEKCEEAVKRRRKARKQFWRRPTPENKSHYNLMSKQAKEAITEAKENSWTKFLSELGPLTPLSTVWRFFKAMKGTIPPTAIPFSNTEDKPLDPQQCAEKLATHYSMNFSHCQTLSPVQDKFAEEALTDDVQIDINQEFKLHEIDRAIAQLKTSSSPGKDLMHNQFLINLPNQQRIMLLELYNQIYNTGDIPKDWKSSEIIPILKPGKDSTLPKSYRPISLLSCISKLMERMVCRRIEFYFESKNMLLPYQFGFRSFRSTTDPLSILEHEIQATFRRGDIMLVVALDLSAAFDRAARAYIIYKLASNGIRGKILRWINNFLSGRTYRVWVQNKSSKEFPINSSVPQGSPFSPYLFNILLSDLPVTKVQKLIYADDITLYVTAETMVEAKNVMQEAIEAIANWCSQWGQAISAEKSSMTYFTRKRGEGTGPILMVNNNLIPYQKTVKLLGITFDSPNLTWKPHIDKLSIKVQKRVDLMKSMAGTKRGISGTHLRTYYQAYIKGTLNYGLSIYTSASPTHLCKLRVIQNAAIRLISGSWKNTAISALYCENALLPPDIHEVKASANQLIKLKSSILDHPIHHLFNRDSWLTSISLSGKQYKSPLLYRTLHPPLNIKIDDHLDKLVPAERPVLPPWFPIQNIVYTSPLELNLNKTMPNTPDIFRSLLEEHFENHIKIYTDGSLIKGEVNKVGASMYVDQYDLKYRWKLNAHHSVISAEIFAISKAINFALNKNLPTVIFTDSMAALSLIASYKPRSYRNSILRIHKQLIEAPNSIRLHWVPGHSQIEGNEVADKEAKKAAISEMTPSEHITDTCEVKSIILAKVTQYWKKRWTEYKGRNHLGSIISDIQDAPKIKHSSRRMEILFSQLRLGRCRLNAPLYKIKKADSPLCEHCPEEETPSHYLLKCSYYEEERKNLMEELGKLNIKKVTIRTLLTNHLATPFVEKFISQTSRFN